MYVYVLTKIYNGYGIVGEFMDVSTNRQELIDYARQLSSMHKMEEVSYGASDSFNPEGWTGTLILKSVSVMVCYKVVRRLVEPS